MNIDNNVCDCLTSCTVKSKYFCNNTVMDDSSSDFQEKKKCSTGPKNVQKSKVIKPKRNLKKIKHQKDIRTLIKKKNSELVSYSKNFDRVCKASGVDVDSEQLQLAIALSKSLQETETKHIDTSQSSKSLTSEEKTLKIRKTLQEYGFRVPNIKISNDNKTSSKRSRQKKNYKLLLASDEEKKEIIAEKYAEVLANNIHKSPSKNISSTNENDQEIFHKATNILYECMKNDDVFYVCGLFEKPLIKSYMLRDWAKIPGRPLSPKREISSFNFDNIQCTQTELDCILSSSILAAQNIIGKYLVHNDTMNTSNKYKSPVKAIDIEINAALCTNKEMEDPEITNSCNVNKINSEVNHSVDTITIPHKVRSVSPDLFDDDISLTIEHDTNNEVQIVKENMTQSRNNVTDFMDLTECVNNGPEINKTVSSKCINSQKKVNMSCRKSLNLMEITECVPTTAEYPVDKIDLTHCVAISKHHTNNSVSETYEIDLTQSSDSNDVPKESIANIQNSLDETIINTEYLEVVNGEREARISDTNTELENNCNIKQVCHIKDNSKSNYYLHEYYSPKKSYISLKEKHFENTECSPLSEKQLPMENIDLTQSFNDSRTDNCSKNIAETDLSERKFNGLLELTECSTSKQCPIDKIDLIHEFRNSTGESHKENLFTENVGKHLTQSSDKISPLKKEPEKSNNSLDESVIIIDDCNLDLVATKQSLNLSNDLDLAIDVNAIINDNCRLLNNSFFNKKSNEIHGKLNNINMEMDLNQPSNCNKDGVQELDNKKTDVTLDKIYPITENLESNSNLEINTGLAVTPKLSNLVCDDDLENCEENHELDTCDNNIINYNYDSYDEHVHNNSDMYDYCIGNDIPENNSQDIVKDFNSDIDNRTPCKEPKHTSHVFDNDTNDIPIDRNDVEEFDNVDLTQSSPEEAIRQISPKAYKISNLGKVDDVSIDYDEMFDDVVSTGSKSATQLSFKSTTNSKDKISNDDVSNPSKTSDCFEISDKEFNYSVHQSRHNFDIGGLSVLDNISDFKEQSIAKNIRSSKANLNRSLSDSDLPSASVKRTFTPKAIFHSKNISETSTPVISRCVINEVQNTPSNNDYIIKTHNVTPMLDYESMTSPERNRELEKYGLKPFKRKRAIQLLRHLYEQTHPIVESCDFIDCPSPSKRRKYNNDDQKYKSPKKSREPINSPRNSQKSPRKSQKSPRKSQKSPRKLEFNLANAEKENMLYAETKKTPDIREVKCAPEDWVFQKREKAKLHSCKVPLHIAFHNYVSCRHLLREAILRYEPINIDVIHKELVASGYKYNPKDLLRFLDKKCITVKTADNNSRNRKT